MTLVPRFAFPSGAYLTAGSETHLLTGVGDQGYNFASREDGTVWGMTFEAFVARLRLPGTRLDVSDPLSGSRLQIRMGGYATSASLAKEQREQADVRLSICLAIKELQEKVRAETGNPSFQLSNRKLDDPTYRRFICRRASVLFGHPILMDLPRGGKRTAFFLADGRTLMKHFRIYEALGPGEDPRDALVPLDHLRGNRSPRIVPRCRELMVQAWKAVGLDTKQPSVASVQRHLLSLLGRENDDRRRNDLPELMMPSPSTLRAVRDEILTPTEYMIATKGERHTKKEKGAGSTDLRALFVGEMVEIDECKASLVASAKAKRIWQRLSPEDQTTLKEMDKEIRARLIILVMIDVASRMPLAWVISDQPGPKLPSSSYAWPRATSCGRRGSTAVRATRCPPSGSATSAWTMARP